MGESTCLMHAFSYASGIPNEAKEGNPIDALKESISFGRFMSDSLAWEKWSSFSHNRYVEEAEKYSQPGSVAEKKAFFEAHYKRIAAAKRAAALLTQANAAINHAPEAELENRDQNIRTGDEKQGISKANFIPHDNGYNSNIENIELKAKKEEGNGQVLVENCKRVEENQDEVEEMELSGKSQMEKPLLKNFNTAAEDLELTSKKKLTLSSSKSLVYSRASKLPPLPSKLIATAPLKENNTTPISKISGKIDDSDKNRVPPKSLHRAIISNPANEVSKLGSPAIEKIGGSRVVASSSKPSKDCLTPLRTPITARVNMSTKHSLATPQSENRRARTQLDQSASGSRTTGPKWRFPSLNCSKSSVNKSQSPIFSSTFGLRTEERAARRKEKLEEKFNVKEAHKVQLQTKIKEKAESELKRLRQSLCFKARPLPDFYRKREASKNQTKIPIMHSQFPKLEKEHIPNTVQSTSLPHRRPSIKKNSSKHAVEKNSQAPPTRSRISLADIMTRENTPPNIQS